MRRRRKYSGETPASLTVTVSFPASFLLNTKRTLLAFLITDALGSMQQEINDGTSVFISEPHVTPDGFSRYSNVLEPEERERQQEEEPISGGTCRRLLTKSIAARLSSRQDGSSLQQSGLISAPETRRWHAAIQIRSETDGNKMSFQSALELDQRGKVLASRPVEDERAAETEASIAQLNKKKKAFSFDLERRLSRKTLETT